MYKKQNPMGKNGVKVEKQPLKRSNQHDWPMKRKNVRTIQHKAGINDT